MKPETLVVEIIKEQSLIIGETLAKSRAEDFGIVQFNSSEIDDITLIQNNPSDAIGNLMKAYEELFGQASVEVCLEVIRKHSIDEIKEYLPDEIKNKINK